MIMKILTTKFFGREQAEQQRGADFIDPLILDLKRAKLADNDRLAHARDYGMERQAKAMPIAYV